MPIDERALRKIDLNLLLAFVVLMRERNVSRAAERLLIGQPGLSGALGRLRDLFGDELLVRVGRGLEPTPRALELIGPVERALALVQDAVLARRGFDPKATERAFAVGLTDDHEMVFGPALAAALHAEAPRASLVVRACDYHTVGASLDAGEVDAALSVRSDLPGWQEHEPLFDQGYTCLWSPEVLRAASPLALDEYVRHPHVLVSFKGDRRGVVDDVLEAQGLRREVGVAVARFAAVPFVLCSTPVIATVPNPVARLMATVHGLALSPPPVAVPSRSVGLLSRRRDAGAADLGWFRALVARTVRSVMADP